MTSPLVRLRTAEAQLIARRAAPPEPAAAVAEGLAAACGEVPAGFAAAGQAIAAAVAAHGASFPPGGEPAYHDRHHQAEAMLCAGWLAREARRAALLDTRQAGLCVLAMAGHDLLHEGLAAPQGALEQRSAAAADRLAATLAPPDRAELTRLILETIPEAPPAGDLAAALVREADLFGSLTPCLGWRLSRALAREMAQAGIPGAARIATHAGRLAFLAAAPGMSPPAVALGLDAARQAQLAAFRSLAATAEAGAALLDALPEEAGRQRWRAALRGQGLPELPG
ncbi:hypothetical protein [Siccirubricoccus phaeus]|uniref:hypothetical protein n=1 Tax=Siccirubricoccus phaeus TaxID=2595053 RepID=UPI0011F3D6CD|nr:hypothetical protein [Siccirubricoccus phaeus]